MTIMLHLTILISVGKFATAIVGQLSILILTTCIQVALPVTLRGEIIGTATIPGIITTTLIAVA